MNPSDDTAAGAPPVEPPRLPAAPPPLPPRLPEARATRSRWFGLVWAVPLAALLIVGFLGLRAFTERGIDVVVTFETAAGARVGDTKVIYLGVEGGYVKKIDISADGRHVEMTLRLDHRAEPALLTSTRFYLIGAKPTLNDLSSLKSTLTGPTIGVAVGQGGRPTRRFAGMSAPPQVALDARGTQYVLTARDLGTARVGSAVFYRGLEIGKVSDVRFVEPDDFKLDVFIYDPHDRLVYPGVRFWISSPVQIALTDKGASANLEHAGALLNGAIELDRPVDGRPAPKTHSPEGTGFPLYASERDATNGPTGPEVPYALRFSGPAGDITAGASVRLLGFEIGSVRSVTLEIDPTTGAASTSVVAVLYPIKLRVPVPATPADDAAWRAGTDAAVNRLLALGHRARLTQKPPLIGGLLISFDRVKGAGAATLGAGTPSRIPSVEVADSLDDIIGQVGQLLAKVNRVPIEAIGDDVHRITSKLDALVSSPQWTSSLQRLDSTLAQTDKMMAEVAPQVGPLVAKLNRAADEVNVTLGAARGFIGGEGGTPDASLPAAIRELSDAARSIRALADYLGRHPESLIRGRGGEPTPPAPPAPKKE